MLAVILVVLLEAFLMQFFGVLREVGLNLIKFWPI